MRAIREPRGHARRVGGVLILVVGTAVGCGGDDGESVPTADELSASLLVADDLADIGTWEFSEQWPSGSAGVIPEDQRDQLPTVDMCEAAIAADLATPKIRWEAGTQLDMVTDTDHKVAVTEFLMAGPADELSATLDDVRSVAETCIAAQPPEGEVTPDGETVRSSLMTAPEVGDERVIVRSVIEEPAGGSSATWDVRYAFVRSGNVLMSTMVLEIDIGDVPVLLSDDDVATVLTVATDKLP